MKEVGGNNKGKGWQYKLLGSVPITFICFLTCDLRSSAIFTINIRTLSTVLEYFFFFMIMQHLKNRKYWFVFELNCRFSNSVCLGVITPKTIRNKSVWLQRQYLTGWRCWLGWTAWWRQARPEEALRQRRSLYWPCPGTANSRSSPLRLKWQT